MNTQNNSPIYIQVSSKDQTAFGVIEITTTLKLNDEGTYDFDDKFVVVNGRSIDIPKAWNKQTSATIVRKVCAMIRGGK